MTKNTSNRRRPVLAYLVLLLGCAALSACHLHDHHGRSYGHFFVAPRFCR